jgi:alpha-soluble NSF attachment protein
MSTVLASQQRNRGDAFYAAATKKLGERTWMASSTEKKNEEAAGLFEQAANAFKVAGADKEAGDAYSKAAEVYTEKLNNVLDGSKCWASAGIVLHRLHLVSN